VDGSSEGRGAPRSATRACSWRCSGLAAGWPRAAAGAAWCLSTRRAARGESGSERLRGEGGRATRTLDAQELAELEGGAAHLGELGDEAFEVGLAHEERRRRGGRGSAGAAHGLARHAPAQARSESCRRARLSRVSSLAREGRRARREAGGRGRTSIVKEAADSRGRHARGRGRVLLRERGCAGSATSPRLVPPRTGSVCEMETHRERRGGARVEVGVCGCRSIGGRWRRDVWMLDDECGLL